MNTFALEIFDDEGWAATLYTLRLEDDANTETDKFFQRYESEESPYHSHMLELLSLVIETIGNTYGATDDFINRMKNKGHALPPKPSGHIEAIKAFGLHFPLRLYCYRLSEQILILFNGGLKDGRTDQESDDLRMKFYETQSFIAKIEQALRDGMIEISPDGRYLVDFQGNKNIIL